MWLRGIFALGKDEAMRLTNEQLKALASATLSLRPDQIGCDEWLDRVGEYLELTLRGEAVPERLRPVAEHVVLRPECREEFEAMRQAIEGDS